MKLCVIYNYAQHYRTNIFNLIDKELGADFVFGDSMGDVKKMDYSLINGRVTETQTKNFFLGWYWQPNVVSQLFKEYDYYLILGETRALSTWLFCILARILKPKKKVFFWSHAWYGKETFLEKLIKKIHLRLPNGGVFCYGNYARELMIKEGFNPNKLYTIHNSLAYDQQVAIRQKLKDEPIYENHFGNTNPNLFFIGRLTPVKKLDQILKAMVISQQHGFYYNLTLIGSGEKIHELQNLTQQLNLQQYVWFYGSCYDEFRLSTLIYNADLCVAPGNIGLTAMHSMVFGTPCITHNDFKWQMPEFEAIKEGITGTFFEKDNVDNLSFKIDSWFKEKSRNRNEIRYECMREIDREWNPYFQLDVLKKNLR